MSTDLPKPGKRKLTANKGRNTKSPSNSSTPARSSPVPPFVPPAPTNDFVPGTSINLEAVVWQENTEAGLVVMNVKWRGKTYCGAFIDIEKHSWQPPRIGESSSPDADHFTRGRNRKSANTASECSERGDDDDARTPTKRGRNGKGKKKRGPVGGLKNKVKKACVAAPVEVPPEVPETPEGSEESEETKKKGKIVCTEQDCNKEFKKLSNLTAHLKTSHSSESSKSPGVTPPETPKSEPEVEETKKEEKTIKTKAPETPILPEQPVEIKDVEEKSGEEGAVMVQERPTSNPSVINSYSPHSKKIKTSINSNKPMPIPKELYSHDTASVIRSFQSKSPINALIKPELVSPSTTLKNYIGAPRGPPIMPIQSPAGRMFPDNEGSAGKPQVIVKPERREIDNRRPGDQQQGPWAKTSIGTLPVLKPQPYFTNSEMTLHPSLHSLVSSPSQHPGYKGDKMKSPQEQFIAAHQKQMEAQQQQQQERGQQRTPDHNMRQAIGHMQNPFKGFDHQNSVFNGLKTNPSDYSQFTNLQRHFYAANQASAIEQAEREKASKEGQHFAEGDHQKMQAAAQAEHHSRDAAQSLLQLARPFSPQTPSLDPFQYLSRLPGNMIPANMMPPTSTPFPIPRFNPDTKETDIAKLMSYPGLPMGPRFPIQQVGKFR